MHDQLQTALRQLRLSGLAETLDGQDKLLAKYLKPDLLIIDDMGMKQLPPQRARRFGWVRTGGATADSVASVASRSIDCACNSACKRS